jgi:hypothetical protein
MPAPRVRLAIPAALVVSVGVAPGCPAPAPTLPNACVSHYSPPDAAIVPPPGVRPQVDLAPCPAQWAGPDWFCQTAAGCQVTYVGETMPAPGAAVQSVACPTTDACLWGIAASGAPVTGPCPQLELQPQACGNTFRFDDVASSSFSCVTTRAGCALGGGATGMQTASVRRVVGGAAEASACPTPCLPFA